jgi:hypothetical protein
MAGNPKWCLSATEWRERFADWLDTPEPHALLNAAIFFDLRPIWGARALAVALRDWLALRAPDAGRFLLLMAQNALGNQPPLGLVREFVLASGGEHPGTLDLKVNGVQPFVERPPGCSRWVRGSRAPTPSSVWPRPHGCAGSRPAKPRRGGRRSGSSSSCDCD